MNWKNFKRLFTTEKYDESQFILGIDLGDATSAICYFDPNRMATEIIDISGGYGKASVPTVIQYIPDTKEWVFGEYAMLNQGTGEDITLRSIIEKLGKNEYMDVSGRAISIVNILSIYLKELIGSCKNINPKAEVAGIIVSVPNYFSEEAREELLKSITAAGYEKELIELVSERECILAKNYFGKKAEKERIMLLDFGSRELRGGIYDIEPDGIKNNVKTLSYLFDENIGTKMIDEMVSETFTAFYIEHTGGEKNISSQIKDQLGAFSYQHKDLLFQKHILSRAVKLYFNFAYPPFQVNFTKEDADNLIAPFKEKMYDFFEKLLNNNIFLEPVDAGDITSVLCTGGGFEMLWAREAVEDIFPDSNITLFKNAKAVMAEGASIIAAEKLGVIDEKEFVIEDSHQIKEDIGIYIKKDSRNKFYPIIERNSFWWQAGKNLKVILNEKTDKPVVIDILKRNHVGEIKPLGAIHLSNLPDRPKGTTKLNINIQYAHLNTLKATVSDCGFGELFPPSQISKDYYLSIE